MAVTVLMPKVGISVETCLIGAWSKKTGDRVAVGDVLFDYETDKAAMECESTADGVILDIFYGDGEEVPVLTPVCAIGEPGEATAGLKGEATTDGLKGEPAAGLKDEPVAGLKDKPVAGLKDEPVAIAQSPDMIAQPLESLAQQHVAYKGEVKISPRAKNLAARLGIDYSNANASGPHGRVIERDVLDIAESFGSADAPNASNAAKSDAGTMSKTAHTNAAQDAGNIAKTGSMAVAKPDNEIVSLYTDAKLPQIRRVIAAAMTKSLSEAAQLTHHHSFDATNILALRAEFKRNGEQFGLGGVSIGDIVLYAVSRLLPDYPDFNAHLLDGATMRRFAGVNLGVAIDTDRGLMVPVVFGANKKSLREISDEVKELARAARAGTINPDDMHGGTFTVSNLGTTGVEMFTPILNAPQVAILGVCGIVARVREAVAGGGIETYPSMGLSLTYDHRAIDGAPASRFAQKLCAGLENINLLLAR